MGFVDSIKDVAGMIGSGVEKGAKTVSASSKKFAEKTKVKREISKLERAIDSLYAEIGKMYFETISEDPPEEYADAVNDIKEDSERLENFKTLLMSLEEKRTCQNCGEQVLKDQKFCDKCGAKIEEIVAPDIEGFNAPEQEAVQQPEQSEETVQEIVSAEEE